MIVASKSSLLNLRQHVAEVSPIATLKNVLDAAETVATGVEIHATDPSKSVDGENNLSKDTSVDQASIAPSLSQRRFESNAQTSEHILARPRCNHFISSYPLKGLHGHVIY